MSYDIIIIGTLLIIAYLASYALYRQNIVTKVLHTRLWNIIFLISFILSASMGALIAGLSDFGIYTGINPDLNFWHIELGIIFFIVLFIHLQSNWSSFRKLLTKYLA
jgi:hypothetical protein